jgi:hypothetical protein
MFSSEEQKEKGWNTNENAELHFSNQPENEDERGDDEQKPITA